MEILVRLESLSKFFPGVIALDKVTFDIRRGEIHGLVGENGAGKSTLGNTIAGKYNDYKGKIYFNEQEVQITSPKMAKKLGVYVVFQESSLIPALDVPTNIFLGQELILDKFKFLLNRKKMFEEAERILTENLKVKIDISKLAHELSASEQQVVSIAKGLTSEADFFILDESTSSLAKSETESLFNIIRELKANNKTVLFISHRLEEIFSIADRISILRDGKHIISKKTVDFTYDEVISAMVGRKVERRYPRSKSYQRKVLLDVKELSRKGEFEDVSFSLHKGEVLGLAGVVGAGRTNLVKTIFGATSKNKGKIFINGRKVEIKSPKIAIKHGIGLLAEDRRNESLIIKLDVLKNIIIGNLREVTKFIFINNRLAQKYASNYVEKLNIKTPSLLQRIEFLSGGNQQKVVLSKWLFAGVSILILDEPTKGIDVGTKFEFYKIIKQLTERGLGIIIVSSEIPELLGLCHNIIVMREGRMVGIFVNDGRLSQEKILSLAITKNG